MEGVYAALAIVGAVTGYGFSKAKKQSTKKYTLSADDIRVTTATGAVVDGLFQTSPHKQVAYDCLLSKLPGFMKTKAIKTMELFNQSKESGVPPSVAYTNLRLGLLQDRELGNITASQELYFPKRDQFYQWFKECIALGPTIAQPVTPASARVGRSVSQSTDRSGSQFTDRSGSQFTDRSGSVPGWGGQETPIPDIDSLLSIQQKRETLQRLGFNDRPSFERWAQANRQRIPERVQQLERYANEVFAQQPQTQQPQTQTQTQPQQPQPQQPQTQPQTQPQQPAPAPLTAAEASALGQPQPLTIRVPPPPAEEPIPRVTAAEASALGISAPPTTEPAPASSQLPQSPPATGDTPPPAATPASAPLVSSTPAQTADVPAPAPAPPPAPAPAQPADVPDLVPAPAPGPPAPAPAQVQEQQPAPAPAQEQPAPAQETPEMKQKLAREFLRSQDPPIVDGKSMRVWLNQRPDLTFEESVRIRDKFVTAYPGETIPELREQRKAHPPSSFRRMTQRLGLLRNQARRTTQRQTPALAAESSPRMLSIVPVDGAPLQSSQGAPLTTSVRVTQRQRKRGSFWNRFRGITLRAPTTSTKNDADKLKNELGITDVDTFVSYLQDKELSSAEKLDALRMVTNVYPQDADVFFDAAIDNPDVLEAFQRASSNVIKPINEAVKKAREARPAALVTAPAALSALTSAPPPSQEEPPVGISAVNPLFVHPPASAQVPPSLLPHLREQTIPTRGERTLQAVQALASAQVPPPALPPRKAAQSDATTPPPAASEIAAGTGLETTPISQELLDLQPTEGLREPPKQPNLRARHKETVHNELINFLWKKVNSNEPYQNIKQEIINYVSQNPDFVDEVSSTLRQLKTNVKRTMAPVVTIAKRMVDDEDVKAALVEARNLNSFRSSNISNTFKKQIIRAARAAQTAPSTSDQQAAPAPTAQVPLTVAAPPQSVPAQTAEVPSVTQAAPPPPGPPFPPPLAPILTRAPNEKDKANARAFLEHGVNPPPFKNVNDQQEYINFRKTYPEGELKRQIQTNWEIVNYDNQQGGRKARKNTLRRRRKVNTNKKNVRRNSHRKNRANRTD